jgi:hypothetical protein
MSSGPSPEEIARDARWLAQALDPATGMLRLVEMDRERYRSESFLDDRMLQKPHTAGVVPWASIAAALPANGRSDARWIFHIGHVGSTLLSRLLGELSGVLAIREPRLLRDLALSPPELRGRYIAPVPQLMSRTFAADEIACVKATSFASEIALELVPAGERALFVYATPANYVASILAGENSVQELRMLAPNRAQRLAARVAPLPPARNDADLAAIAWACEMTALESAAEAMPDRRIEWCDFDRALADVEGTLASVAEFFGFEATESQVREIARGPLMKRYSKALEHEYTPDLRRDLIAGATASHSGEIAGALAMLETAAEKSPLLARALRRPEEH